MKSVSKKVISVVLAVLMALSLSVAAFATEGPAAFNFDYSAAENEDGRISGFTGTVEDIIDGVLTLVDIDPRTEIKLAAVEDGTFIFPDDDIKEAVTAIVFPEGIGYIGSFAFAALPNLEKVTFMGDVKIGESAFAYCTALKTVEFMGDADLDEYAFAGCEALADITAPADAAFGAGAYALNDTAWFQNQDAANDYIMLNTTLVAFTGHDAEVVVPLGVTAIGKSAFEGNTEIEKVTVRKDVVALGDKAFYNCANLNKVVFDDCCEITEIGNDVFTGTEYFNEYEGEFFILFNQLIKYMYNDVPFVTIPNTVKRIADDAFMGCYKYNEKDEMTFVIESILVPASVTEIGNNALTLVEYEDGTIYAPVIFAYSGAKNYAALTEAGYNVKAMNLPGDVDNDGKLTAADARLALRIAVGLDKATEAQKSAADLNKDGKVTAADARLILRVVVGLEGYTAEELLYKPETTYEVLAAYETAVKEISKSGKGYLMQVSNQIVDSNINKYHRARIEGLAATDSENANYLVKAGTKVAAERLPEIDLNSTKDIKSATCTYEDGKVVYTIKFNDVKDAALDVDNTTYLATTYDFAKLIDTVNGVVFVEAFKNNASVGVIKWFEKFVADSDIISANCVRKYELTYTNPTIKMVANKTTGEVESITLSVGYHFVVDARINGIDVSGISFKVGDATVDRLDTVVYSNFAY